MDNNSKNRWVDEALDSINNAYRAMPDDALFNKIEQRLNVPFTKKKVIPLRIVSAAAACIIVLIMTNIYTIYIQKGSNVGRDGAQSVAAYYDINNTANEIMGL
ncbi:MAG: hypothetical protein JST82_02900 [Bacteroidetes bacterium]|nr:hypothetical protein [Bacteroidota bacterium]